MNEDYNGMAEQFKKVADKTVDSEEYVNVALVLYRLGIECRLKAVLVSQNRFNQEDKHHKLRKLAENCKIGIPEEILYTLEHEIPLQHNKSQSQTYSGTWAFGPNTTDLDLISTGKVYKVKCVEIWRLTAPHLIIRG